MIQDKKDQFKTTCSYCGVGCGIIVKKDRNNKIVVEGDKDHPVNKGLLCSKGMNLHYVVEDKSDRLLYPEMRWNRDLPRERVSWEMAMTRAAAVFKSFISKYGPDSVGFYVSGQCLTEEYYIVNKLTKGFLGTNNIDTNSRLCMSSAVVGYKMALGEDSVPISYDDIELADCFFITGANPAWCHPILFRRLEAHKNANPDVKIIVADPRKTQSCAIADLHLQLKPGTDIILYHAIARCLIENNFIDWDFIEDHTEGFIEFKEKVFQTTIEEAAALCDVPVDQIKLAAYYIGEANGFISMWAMGLNQSVIGVNKNLALINLSLITGQIGKPGSGPFSLTGQPNAMGGREVGGLSNMLPAHRNLNNPDHRKEVAEFWGVPSVPEKPGLTATEMFDNLLSGKMKAIWIICTNPLVSLPDARNVEVALKNAKFVIVQDISNKSDTLEYADLVLPAAGWLEKEGTMTNSERRISYLNKVINAPGEALPDIEILKRFADKMGFENNFNYKNASDIFDEHCRLTKGTNVDIGGLNYEILKSQGSIQWPYTQEEKQSTPRLFSDHQFFTPSKKAKISNVPSANQSEPVNNDFPFILTTGRIRDQWHTMTRTGKVRKLNQHISKSYLEINPTDAEIIGVVTDDIVEVFNARGSVMVQAKVTDEIKRGVVFLPMHWGKILNKDFSRANNITSKLIDPISKEPDFKFSAVQVKKFKKPVEKVIIIGAGAASFQFVQRYRELNDEDELVVFSKETYHFYNRVMLPEYISGHQEWHKLIKASEEELLNKGIKIISKEITQINSEEKYVLDSVGNRHFFDKLIIATGSRASLPKDMQSEMKGRFTMRYRKDADKLKSYIEKGDNAVIVGGGLLGLELADSLKQLGINVKVVQRSSRLMDRQLDNLGSELLYQEMFDRNIEVFFNEEVLNIIGNDCITGVRLKSGRKLDCKVLIYAIGTTPNIELAKNAGVKCNRGIIVDDYLQTSVTDIFALGEVAEFNQSLFGITAAAEEQATLAAEFINGNLASRYEGSLSMNILKMHGLNLCSIGMVEIPSNSKGYDEILYIDKAKKYYKKCIVHDDRLVGAILIGDKSEFNEFKQHIKNRTELSDKRLTLLIGKNTPGSSVLGKLVCACNNVGEGNIQNAIEEGCKDITTICQKTGAGTGCGSCRPEVKLILENCQIVKV